jgi:hypothetical protein
MTFVLLVAPLTLTGCPQIAAQLLPIVTDIITDFLDAERKLEQVDAQAQAWFAKYPNEKMRTDWQKAVDEARATLDVALKTARGAEDLAESDYQAAFQKFGLAWQQVIELATSVGIVSAAGTYGAGPMMGARVEPPVCLARMKAKP